MASTWQRSFESRLLLQAWSSGHFYAAHCELSSFQVGQFLLTEPMALKPEGTSELLIKLCKLQVLGLLIRPIVWWKKEVIYIF